MTVVRPAREEDVEAAAEMLNEHSRRLHGTDDMTAADLLLYWTSPDVELGQDVLLAESADGRLGGYADLGVHGDAVWLDVRGTDPATLPVMLEAIERKGSRRAGQEALGLHLRPTPCSSNCLNGRYRRARHSFHMRIDLDGDQSDPGRRRLGQHDAKRARAPVYDAQI
jgi:hypothetical protein